MSVPLTSELQSRADRYVEDNHGRFAEIGRFFFDVFGYDRSSGRISTQVRNLQQIVCSATRFADVEDFVKNQMGKTGSVGESWRDRTLGRPVLDQLGALREAAAAKDLSATPEQRLSYRLALARGWVRAVVGEYLYRVALDRIGEKV